MKGNIKAFDFQQKKIILILLVLLFLIALGQQFYRLYFIFKQERFVDFYVYWEAAKLALKGGDFYQKLYFEGTPFNYPPTALPFFSILSFFQKSVASLVLLAVSLSSLLASIFLLIKLLFKKPERVFFFLLSSILFIQFFPTKFTLTLGQINLVILFFITGSFYFFKKKKNTMAGIFLALASLIKIFPAFLMLFYLKEKKKKTIFSFLFVCLLGILLTMILLKPSSIFAYFGGVGKNLFFQAGNLSYFDQSLNSFLMRLNLAADWRLLLRIVLSLFLANLFLKSKNKAFSFFGLAVMITIFFPSFVWLHHYVVLIPLMVVLFVKINNLSNFLLKALLLIGYFVCSLHFRNPKTLVNQNIILISHPFFGALILIFLAMHSDKLEKL